MTIGWSQDRTIDSLKANLSTQSPDTTKVNTLLNISEKLFRSQPDEAITFGRDAIVLSEKLDFEKGRAYALKNIGLAYFVKGNYDQVLNYWNQSLAAFQSIDDRVGISNLLNNLGAVYFNQGDYPRALDYYLQSLRVSEETGNELRIATALTNIGAVYFEHPVNHGKARQYYLRALQVSEKTGDPAAIGTSIVNLGETYIVDGKLDSALYFFERARKAYDDSGANAAYILNNIARVKALQGAYGRALELHREAYAEAEAVAARLEMTQSLNGIGHAYLELGELEGTPSNYRQALAYLEQAFEEAQQGGWQPEIESAAEGLYRYYKHQNDPARALQYHEIYESTKYSLLDEENINLLALLSAEYENEKERQQLEYEIRRQQSIQLATAAGLVTALILIGLMIQYYRLYQKRAAEKLEAQQQLLRQDKLASLGQITAGIAHEIKNPLNFVTNFAEGSLEFGAELEELIDQHRDKLPEDQYQEMRDLIMEIKNNAKIIQENGVRADRVVKRMMEQARADSGEARKVDINSLIDENLYLAYHGFRATAANFYLDMEKVFDPTLPPIEVIPQDIGRVVLNIVHNACYALREQQLELGEAFHPNLQVSTELVDQEVLIRFRDNGTGIPKKVINKIFNPFFTTKPSDTDNTGLGLSISRDVIVIGHQGRIEVDSEAGEYTEFRIWLPVERPASPLGKQNTKAVPKE